MGALFQVLFVGLIIFFIYKRDKISGNNKNNKLSEKEKNILILFSILLVSCLCIYAIYSGLKIKDLFLIVLSFLIIYGIARFFIFLFKFVFGSNNNKAISFSDKKSELEKLFVLKEKGIITEQQFEQKKSDILNK